MQMTRQSSKRVGEEDRKTKFYSFGVPKPNQTSQIFGILNFRKARIAHPNKDPMAQRQYVARQIGNRMQKESGRGDRGKKGREGHRKRRALRRMGRVHTVEAHERMGTED